MLKTNARAFRKAPEKSLSLFFLAILVVVQGSYSQIILKPVWRAYFVNCSAILQANDLQTIYSDYLPSEKLCNTHAKLFHTTPKLIRISRKMLKTNSLMYLKKENCELLLQWYSNVNPMILKYSAAHHPNYWYLNKLLIFILKKVI